MTAVTRTLLLAAALLLAACNTGFEPQYRVNDVRILAVRDRVQGTPATADVAPGETVVLEALVARPRSGTRVSWFGCLPAASEATTPCADRSFLDDPSRLARDRSIVPIGSTVYPAAGGDPDLVASATLPLTDPATVTTLEDALDFRLGPAVSQPAFACRLYTDLDVIAVVEAPGVRPQAALKRVRITSLQAIADQGLPEIYSGDPYNVATLYNLNLNPAVQSVRLGATDPDACTGGTPLASGDALPGGRIVLCGQGDTGQEINVCDAKGPKGSREDYQWQWYVSAGEFPDEGGIGNATGILVDFIRPAGPFSMWTIVRDQRGGAAWARRDFP